MKLIISLFAFIAISASNVYAAAGWQPGTFTVSNISIEGTENAPVAYINLAPTSGTSWPSNHCTEIGYVSLNTNNERGKQAFSTILMAAASNKNIAVRFDSACDGARFILTGVNAAS